MRIRKHFRTSSSTIDLLVLDMVSNRIVNREVFFNYCVNDRLNKLNDQYDKKLDKFVTYVILNYNYYDLPLDCVSRMIMSITKVTNALTKGIISILK